MVKLVIKIMKKNPENLRLSASQKGFTLLEVLIAIVILSIGLLGMAALTASIIRTTSFSDDYTTSTVLAQDKMEQLFNTSFGSLATGTDTVGANGNAGTKYTRTWTLGSGTSTKTIDVSVAWTSHSGSTKSISISTIKSNQ